MIDIAEKIINGEDISSSDAFYIKKNLMGENKNKLIDILSGNLTGDRYNVAVSLSFLAEHPLFKDEILDIFENTSANIMKKDKNNEADDFVQRSIVNGLRRMLRTGVKVTSPVEADRRSASWNRHIHIDGHVVKDDAFSIARLKKGMELSLKLSNYNKTETPSVSGYTSEYMMYDAEHFMRDMLQTNNYLYNTGKISSDDAYQLDETLKQISDNMDKSAISNKYVGNPLEAYDKVKKISEETTVNQ